MVAGGGNSGLIVFTEREGQMRLLREVHAAADLTIRPSAAPQLGDLPLRRARPPRRSVDWGPYRYHIAGIAAAKLRRFGLRVPAVTLVLTPHRFTRREIALHAYHPRVPPQSPQPRPTLARRRRRHRRPPPGPGHPSHALRAPPGLSPA